MSNFTKGFLIFIGVIVSVAVIGLVLFFAITEMVRNTARDALSPISQANGSLQTKVAQLSNQTPTVIPNPITVIHEVRSLARLETIQYSLEKVITVEQGQNQLGFLFGDKLLFVAHGRVIAGVDLSRMRPEDMWVENQVLNVRLPPAEVFVVNLDSDKSYVYNRETGLLTKGDVNLEKVARQAAEKEILKAAIDDGMLAQAQQNAESYMSRMLRGLGYPDVVFVHDQTPQPALPTPTAQ